MDSGIYQSRIAEPSMTPPIAILVSKTSSTYPSMNVVPITTAACHDVLPLPGLLGMRVRMDARLCRRRNAERAIVASPARQRVGSGMTFPLREADLDLMCDARRLCQRKALYIVRIHNVHDCAGDQGLTPAGDTVWLMCESDLAGTTWRLGVMVGEMYADIPDDDTDETTVPECATCGRSITDVDDVMTVEPVTRRL